MRERKRGRAKKRWNGKEGKKRKLAQEGKICYVCGGKCDLSLGEVTNADWATGEHNRQFVWWTPGGDKHNGWAIENGSSILAKTLLFATNVWLICGNLHVKIWAWGNLLAKCVPLHFSKGLQGILHILYHKGRNELHPLMIFTYCLCCCSKRCT